MVEQSLTELINYGVLGIILVLIILAFIYFAKKAMTALPRIISDAIQAYKESQKDMQDAITEQTTALVDLTKSNINLAESFITQFNDVNIEIGHIKEDIEDIKDVLNGKE